MRHVLGLGGEHLRVAQSASQRLRSAHLYQLGTYLDHFGASHDLRGRRMSGLLLYAAPPTLPAQSYNIRGRRVCIRSLRLDQPWQGIHDDLLGLVTSLGD